MTTASEPNADSKPQPPEAPESWACCQSGCDPCIYDIYWQALERYEQALREWAGRQVSQGNKS